MNLRHRNALTDLKALEVALAIFPESVAIFLPLVSFLVGAEDISRSALADLKASQMALAIFPGSVAHRSCMAAKRAVEGPSPCEGAAPILAPSYTTLDFNILGHFYFESYRCFPFSVQMLPSSD